MLMAIWMVVGADGKTICHCGCEQDACWLAEMVPGRSYRKMLRLAPEIIDVTAIMTGELPGNLGLPGRGVPLGGGAEGVLPEGVGVPLGAVVGVPLG